MAVPAAAAPRTAAARAPASAAAAVTVPVPSTAPASAATGPERLPQLAELAEALRREIGPLNPGGSIYAEQPSARMVILNGQVFREGDTLSGQLRIEQIRPRSVVLGLRGQRFELAL
jgi:general secretion pathway protein B